MAKHRTGDRRILSISIPEDLARKLDKKVGKGQNDGRSATISKMIENSLYSSNNSKPYFPEKQRRFRSPIRKLELRKILWVM